MNTPATQSPQIPCGSGLARDSGVPGAANVGCEALKLCRGLEAAIAGKPAPTGDRECFHDRVHLTSGGVVKVW